MNPQKFKKRRISQCRVISQFGHRSFASGSGWHSDWALSDSQSSRILFENGEFSGFSVDGAEEAELAIVIEVAESFFGAGEIAKSCLGKGLCDVCLLFLC